MCALAYPLANRAKRYGTTLGNFHVIVTRRRLQSFTVCQPFEWLALFDPKCMHVF